MKVIVSRDEWYPYYEIQKYESYKYIDEEYIIVDMSEKDYTIYRGLLLQVNKLQLKLDGMFEKAGK